MSMPKWFYVCRFFSSNTHLLLYKLTLVCDPAVARSMNTSTVVPTSSSTSLIFSILLAKLSRRSRLLYMSLTLCRQRSAQTLLVFEFVYFYGTPLTYAAPNRAATLKAILSKGRFNLHTHTPDDNTLCCGAAQSTYKHTRAWSTHKTVQNIFLLYSEYHLCSVRRCSLNCRNDTPPLNQIAGRALMRMGRARVRTNEREFNTHAKHAKNACAHEERAQITKTRVWKDSLLRSRWFFAKRPLVYYLSFFKLIGSPKLLFISIEF